MRLSRTGLLVLLFVAIPAIVIFSYDPLPGAEDVYDLYSPLFLGGRGAVASSESPSGDVANPAVSGLKQRTTVDVSYLTLAGFGTTDSGIGGHVVNLGATFPTRVGVFSGQLNFLNAGLPSVDLGTSVGINASFAKDLFPDLLFGVGLGTRLGGENGTFDYGIGLDLGILHLPGDIAFMKNFRWGLALQDLGKGFSPVDGNTGIPSPFTPSAAAAFELVEIDGITLGMNAGLSVPLIQNARFSLGVNSKIADLITVDFGWGIDFRELIESGRSSRSLIPSFGVGVHLRTDFQNEDSFLAERGWNRSEVQIRSSAAPLFGDVWAIGLGANAPLGVIDRVPPEISIQYAATDYVSPNNDGSSDALIFPINIEDERFVRGYELIIRNESGDVVRTIRNKDDRPENQGFQNILDRLFAVKSGVSIPEQLRWDGTSDTGTPVPDGTYSFVLESFDDNGNRASTEPAEVVIDTTQPAVEIAELPADDLIFSPNDDGNKDTLTIAQTGSEEDTWTARITDVLGKAVRTVTWQNGAPEAFVWDGTNDGGIIVPDGVYNYTVTSTDRADNRGAATVQNIIISTEATPIAVVIDQSFFSPNGDAVKDTIHFRPEIPITDGIVEWTISVLAQDGTSVRDLAGSGEPPEEIEFDGLGSDGSVLDEGTYTGLLSVLYRNGNNPQEVSPEFVVDLTDPNATIISDVDIFSPNSDGRKDVVTFTHETSVEPSWRGRISDVDGNAIRSFSWLERPERTTIWNGTREDGSRAPDGEYVYFVTATDRAGNVGVSNQLRFELKTVETPLSVGANIDAFSPNNDGVRDELRLIPQPTILAGIESYMVRFYNEAGRMVFEETGRGRPPASYGWDGRTSSGSRAPDGQYYGEVQLTYDHGNQPTSRTGLVLLDTTPPTARVAVPDKLFSPDGDGNKDTVLIRQSSSRETAWTGRIENEAGQVVRTFVWQNELADFEWDGTNESGNRVSDGEYRYVVGTTDIAGNKLESAVSGLAIDTREVSVFVQVSAPAFSPNGDGTLDNLVFTIGSNIDDGIDRWELVVENVDGGVFKRFSGLDLEPRTEIEWDGRGDRGRVVEGSYSALFSVRYERGTEAEARTISPFVVDTTAPSATVAAEFDVFSPNGDGNKDRVRLTADASREQSWRGEIKDANGTVVRELSWVGAPAPLVWTGQDGRGQRVSDGRYTYQVSSTDRAGNMGQSRPVEVVVNTQRTPLSLAVDPAAFSPNGDRVRDTIDLTPTVGNRDGVESYRLRILDTDGEVVRTISGAGVPPERFQWDGRTDSRVRLPDGEYVADLLLVYRHGNQPEAQTDRFVLDTTAPTVELETQFTLFSPDGDGKRDEVFIDQTSSREGRWSGRILSADGTVVRTFNWDGALRTVAWNGTDEAGNRVPDGTYRYEVSATDAAGNQGSDSVAGLTVDTRPTRVFVTAGATGLSPNGDGEADRIEFSMYVNLTDGADSWQLDMVRDDDTVARTFRGSTVRGNFTQAWNGRTEDGDLLEGTYAAVFRVSYKKGNEPTARTTEFDLDVSPPEVDITLDGLPFSPDNDGLNDELRILLDVEDQSGIAAWTFRILDRNDRPFTEFSGRGSPSSAIIWDGRSATGDTVISAEDYPYELEVNDVLGNRVIRRGRIPIDILVVRDGNRLKVQIASITFQPNSPALVVDPTSEQGQKNLDVLRRLVEVFAKYRDYDIRIEGHAVNISGTPREEREELQPLSLARAQEVKDALVGLGMSERRISVLGRGGTEPVVPHTDVDERWKNRRVEFILIR